MIVAEDRQCWHVHCTLHQRSAKGVCRQALMSRSLLNIMHYPVYDPFYPHDHSQEAARCRVRVNPMMCPIVPDGAPPQSQSTNVHYPSAWVHPLCGHPIVGSRLWAIGPYGPFWVLLTRRGRRTALLSASGKVAWAFFSRKPAPEFVYSCNSRGKPCCSSICLFRCPSSD